MTQRERRLSVAAGAVVACLVLWGFVQGVILEPITTTSRQLEDLQTQKTQLFARAQMKPAYKRHWQQLQSKTLAANPNIAAGQLDVLIKRLMQEAGLTNLSVNVGRPREEKKAWPGLYIIPYTVITAEGSMEAFTKFLHAFYRQPYAMQILSYNLEQPVALRNRENPLKVSSLRIEAITLNNQEVPKDMRATVDEGEGKLSEPWRPTDPDVLAYTVLWDKQFMEPYTEPVAPPPPPPPPATPTVAQPLLTPNGGPVKDPTDVRIRCTTAGATIRYTTDGSMPSRTHGEVYDNSKPIRVDKPTTIRAIAYRDKMKDSPVATASFSEPPPPPLKLIALWTYGPINEAVLIDEQTQQRQYVEEGAPFDGGQLLLVLPEAAVAEMPDGPRYVYRLGQPLAQKELLDPMRQPDIAAAVEILIETQW